MKTKQARSKLVAVFCVWYDGCSTRKINGCFGGKDKCEPAIQAEKLANILKEAGFFDKEEGR